MNSKYHKTGIQAAIGWLNEECGEVVAAIGKTQRHGLESVNPELPIEQQEKNIDWIFRECDDVILAIENFTLEYSRYKKNRI